MAHLAGLVGVEMTVTIEMEAAFPGGAPDIVNRHCGIASLWNKQIARTPPLLPRPARAQRSLRTPPVPSISRLRAPLSLQMS